MSRFVDVKMFNIVGILSIDLWKLGQNIQELITVIVHHSPNIDLITHID